MMEEKTIDISGLTLDQKIEEINKRRELSFSLYPDHFSVDYNGDDEASAQFIQYAQLANDRARLAESCIRDLVDRLYKEIAAKQEKDALIAYWMQETKKWRDARPFIRRI
jgi:Fe-S-cluster containining protein